MAGTAAGVGLAWRLKKVLLVAAGVGLTVAAVSYVTTHGVAAVLSGLGATVTAVAPAGPNVDHAPTSDDAGDSGSAPLPGNPGA